MRKRIAALGVGPHPIPRNKLSVQRLADAIHTATSDPKLRGNAAALGERIRAEDGVARAVTAFHRHLSGHAAIQRERVLAIEPA